MVTRSEIRRKYEQLDKAAQKHSRLEVEFKRLESQYYGFNYEDSKKLLMDDFISGLSLGEGGDFELYDEMMMEEKTRRDDYV